MNRKRPRSEHIFIFVFIIGYKNHVLRKLYSKTRRTGERATIEEKKKKDWGEISTQELIVRNDDARCQKIQ